MLSMYRPAEVEKLQMLAQDPRPFQEKQAVLAQVNIESYELMFSKCELACLSANLHS